MKKQSYCTLKYYADDPVNASTIISLAVSVKRETGSVEGITFPVPYCVQKVIICRLALWQVEGVDSQRYNVTRSHTYYFFHDAFLLMFITRA